MESYNSLHPIDAKNVIEPAKPKPDKVKIGDYVRTRNIRGTIDPKLGLRGILNYSDQVYRIISKTGNRYILTDVDMTKIIKEALAQNLQVVQKPKAGANAQPKADQSPISLETIKNDVTKAKKFTKFQRDSKLNIDNSGTIVPPIIPSLPKKAIRKPSYLNDYV